MKDKQGLNRWSLLEQAGTVLDERFHHDAIYSHLVETAAYGRQLEAEIARLRDEVERLRLTDAEREALEFFGSGSDRAASRELLTAVSEIPGPDAAAGSRAQIMAGLIDDFNRHGDVVCNLLARHGGER